MGTTIDSKRISFRSHNLRRMGKGTTAVLWAFGLLLLPNGRVLSEQAHGSGEHVGERHLEGAVELHTHRC